MAVEAPVYRYYTVDLLTNKVLSEIPFRQVSYERALKGAGAFMGQIPIIDATESFDVYTSTFPGNTALYAIRDGVCVWGGIIWSRSYNLVERALVVNASEFTSYFYHRKIWKTWGHSFGATLTVTNGVAQVNLDYGSETTSLRPQASVLLEFGEETQFRYNGYYSIAGTPTPTKDIFFIDKIQQKVNLNSAELLSGVATLGAETPHGFIEGDLVTVDVGGQSVYNGTHAVSLVSGPGGVNFSFLNSDLDDSLKTISGVATRFVPDGVYTGVTVSVRADTYDYIRSLVQATLVDFVGVDFPNVYIEPGISFGYNITEREISDGLARVKTKEAHGLSVGQAVQIVDLDPRWDGEYVVFETPSSNEFKFELGGTVASEPVGITEKNIERVSASGGLVTITTTEPHNFYVGQTIDISTGIQLSDLGGVLNGSFSVANIFSETSFGYTTTSTTNVPDTDLTPATSISASDINQFPNPSFEGVVSGIDVLRKNLVPYNTIFGNSSFFSFDNSGGGGTGAIGFTEEVNTFPSDYALRYTVSTAPSATGTFFGMKPNFASGFTARTGAPYTASVYVYSQYATTVSIGLAWINSAQVVSSVSQGEEIQLPAKTVVRLSVLGNAPADTLAGAVRVYHDARNAQTDDWIEFSSHMVEQTNQLRDYFDGSLPNTFNYDYNWSGPANRSTSVAQGVPVTVRTNLSRNPGAESHVSGNTEGYTSNILVTQSSEQVYAGTNSFKCEHNGLGDNDVLGLTQSATIQSGTTYAVSARIRIPSVNVGFPSGTGKIQIGDDTTEFIYTIAEDEWVRVSSTVTALDSGNLDISIVFYPNATWSGGDVFYVDSILIEESTTINEYFDGNTFSAGDYIYNWEGVPQASVSYQQAPSVFSVNTSNCMAYQSVEWQSTGSKSMRITPTNSISNESVAVGWNMPEFIVGRTYIVKAKIRLDGPLTGTLNENSRRIVVVRNGTGTLARTDSSPNFESVREVSTTFVVPSATTSLRIDLYNGASKGNGDVWWDDLMVVEVDDVSRVFEYFDGDTKSYNYYSFAWSGVPHSSASERRITTSISETELVGDVVTITTDIPHGYEIGRPVTISGITPELEIAQKSYDSQTGVATITTVEDHEFDVGENVEVSGLRDISELSRRSVVGSTVTMTTRLGHNFSQGETVKISSLKDISFLNQKEITSNIVTLGTKKSHNIQIGDTVEVSDIFDTYTIYDKRVFANVARLTLSELHNFKVNDVIAVAGMKDTADVITKTVENGRATLTTRFPHNFAEGQEEVVISGLGEPYDGVIKIASVASGQISYEVAVAPEEFYPPTSADGLITSPNSVFNGSFVLSAVTNTTISFSLFANGVVPELVDEGIVAGVSPINGRYVVTGVPTNTSFAYPLILNNVISQEIPEPVTADKPENQQPPATANIQSIHTGERLITSVSRNTFNFIQDGIPNDISIENIAGLASIDSIFNGLVPITGITENTFTYNLDAPSNVLETPANNVAFVRAPQIFNDTFTITEVNPVDNTFKYVRPHRDLTKRRVFGYGRVKSKPSAVVGTFGPFPGSADIGMDFSTRSYSGVPSIPTIFRGFELRSVGEVLDEYSDGLNGFDYRIDSSFNEATNEFRRTFVLIPLDYPNPPAKGEVSPLSRFGADKFVFDYPGNIIDIQMDESSEESATRFFAIGESDLGPDAGPPIGIASNTDMLNGKLINRRWPLLDAEEVVSGIDDETILFSYAKRYLTEARPPDLTLSMTVNGSLQPFVGSYNPGDWCSVIVNDIFFLERMGSGLEPRNNVLVRKIDSIKVTVPDGTTFPESVQLTLLPDWDVDKIGD